MIDPYSVSTTYPGSYVYGLAPGYRLAQCMYSSYCTESQSHVGVAIIDTLIS